MDAQTADIALIQTHAERLVDQLRAMTEPDPDLVRDLAPHVRGAADRGLVLRTAASYGQNKALELLFDAGIRPPDDEHLSLILACNAAEFETARLLIREGANPRDHEDEALVAAAGAGCEPLVSLLLDSGCSASAQNNAALLLSLGGGHASIAARLLAHGASVLDLEDEVMRHACLAPAGAEACYDLVAHLVPSTTLDDVALPQAVWRRNEPLVTRILAAGANPTAQNCSALLYALSAGDERIFGLLISAAISRQYLHRSHLRVLSEQGHSRASFQCESEAIAAGYEIPDN